MSMLLSSAPTSPEDRFGRAVARRLSLGHAAVHPDIGERLRVARQQALAQRKPEIASVVAWGQDGQAAAGVSRWWSWGASVFPLLALVVGLVAITQWQAEDRADAIAEIDAALLTDELPTAAYTDPGFRQFLQRDSAMR